MLPGKKTKRKNVFHLIDPLGHVMELRYDLHWPFAHQKVQEKIHRYAIDYVYRTSEGSNFQLKRMFECAFHIIIPSESVNSCRLTIDTELISIACKLAFLLPFFNQRMLSFRVNHTSMLRAIMLHHNVPGEKQSAIFNAVLDVLDDRISEFQLQTIVGPLLEKSGDLIDVLLTEIRLDSNVFNFMDVPSIRNLVKGHGEASRLARYAMKEIDYVAKWTRQIGLKVTTNSPQFHECCVF